MPTTPATASLGRLLVVLGLLIAFVGALLWFFAKLLPGGLPGDIRIERPGWTLNVPIVTSIVISVILTIVLNLVLRWRR